jgi:hypothetical protein
MTRPGSIYDYDTLYRGDYMRAGFIERAALLARMIDPSWDIIEVGAGRGDLAHTMSTLGYRWTAYDVVSSARVIAGELPTLHGSIPWRRYECTVTIDVLEHIAEPDIPAALLDLKHLAKRGVWSVANMSDVHQVAGVDVELHLTRRGPEWWQDQIHILSGSSVVHVIDSARFWLEVTW